MSTHDYNIANQIAVNLREDINDALEAIVSTNSNATAPTTTYQYMWWYDTTNDLLKMRNESNSAWITIGYVDQSNLNFQPYIGGTQVTEVLDEDDMASDSDTGVPTQQSVKAYVDALDTTVDGVDVKNRYTSTKSATGGSWVTFTGLSGVKSVTLMVEGESTSGQDRNIDLQTSSNNGASWSSDKLLNAVGANSTNFFRIFVDFDSGNYWSTSSVSSRWNRGTHSFSSGIDSVRLRVENDSIWASLLIEEGES